jgi:hypothetical protein
MSNEIGFFKKSHMTFLILLQTMRDSWMTKEEIERYHIASYIRKERLRIFIGEVLDLKNPLSKFLVKLYFGRRMRKMQPIS